jgi:hypothetical protein
MSCMLCRIQGAKDANTLSTVTSAPSIIVACVERSRGWDMLSSRDADRGWPPSFTGRVAVEKPLKQRSSDLRVLSESMETQHMANRRRTHGQQRHELPINSTCGE